MADTPDPEFIAKVREAAATIEKVFEIHGAEEAKRGTRRTNLLSSQMCMTNAITLRTYADDWEQKALVAEITRDVISSAAPASQHTVGWRQKDFEAVAQQIATGLAEKGYRRLPDRLDMMAVRDNGLIDIDDTDT